MTTAGHTQALTWNLLPYYQHKHHPHHGLALPPRLTFCFPPTHPLSICCSLLLIHFPHEQPTFPRTPAPSLTHKSGQGSCVDLGGGGPPRTSAPPPGLHPAPSQPALPVTVLVAGRACSATSGCGTACGCSPGTCCSLGSDMTAWLLSAGAGGTSSGCCEEADVGGRWGGRIFSAISCSLILLIRTRLSSCGRERRRPEGAGAASGPLPQAAGPPRAGSLDTHPTGQTEAPGKAERLREGLGRQRTKHSSYLAGHGGRRGPEVGVVKSRLGHPAGRERLSRGPSPPAWGELPSAMPTEVWPSVWDPHPRGTLTLQQGRPPPRPRQPRP